MKITKENNVSCLRCGEKNNLVLVFDNPLRNIKTYGCNSCFNMFETKEPKIVEYNPDTKEFNIELKKNQLLFTKDDELFSNCIIIDALKKEGTNIVYRLKSDHGYKFNLTAMELDLHFYISLVIVDHKHKHYREINYGY